MTHAGGCHCGAIRYEVAGDPVHSALCHCTDCRKASGAPMVHWALFPQTALTVSGEPANYASSPGTTRQFCAGCGTSLFYWNESLFPGQVDVQAATLDDPSALPPGIHIQMADAGDWVAGMAELPKFDRYPG